MKIFFIVALALLACNSTEQKKEAIVERQKEINSEMELLEFKIDSLWNFTERHDNVDSTLLYIKAMVSPLNIRVSLLRKEFDSLEMELKKY